MSAKLLCNVKKLQKTHLKLNFFLLKCFSNNHNFLDWYEIFKTQSRLVCPTYCQKLLETNIIWRWSKWPKFTIIKKYSEFFGTSKWLPNIQNILDWHESFTTISRHSKRNLTQQIFIENEHLMKEIQAPKVATIKMQFKELKFNPWTSKHSQKISTCEIDLKIISHKLEERAQISQRDLFNLDIIRKS